MQYHLQFASLSVIYIYEDIVGFFVTHRRKRVNDTHWLTRTILWTLEKEFVFLSLPWKFVLTLLNGFTVCNYSLLDPHRSYLISQWITLDLIGPGFTIITPLISLFNYLLNDIVNCKRKWTSHFNGKWLIFLLVWLMD